MKWKIGMFVLFGVLFSIFSIQYVVGYEIIGDKVVIDDSNVYLATYPHTVNESGWVYFNLTSKIYEGNIDVVWGFDSTKTRPTAAEYWNGEAWQGISSSFSSIDYNYNGMNKWYYVENVPVIANKEYMARGYVEIHPTSPLEQNEKYFFCVKPSAETIQEAIANGHLYCLDPWWSSSWTYKKQLTITTVDALDANFTAVVGMNTISDDIQDDCDDIRIVINDNLEIDRTIDDCNSANSIIKFKLNDAIGASSTNTSYYVYYGNPSSTAAPTNRSEVYMLFDDFEDGTFQTAPAWQNTTGTIDWMEVLTHGNTSINNYMSINSTATSNFGILWPVNPTYKYFEISYYFARISLGGAPNWRSRADVWNGTNADLGQDYNGTANSAIFLEQLESYMVSSKSFTINDDSWLWTTYNKTQSNSTVYVDNVQYIASNYDSSATARNITFRCWGNSATVCAYDNISIQLLVTNPPTYSLGVEEEEIIFINITSETYTSQMIETETATFKIGFETDSTVKNITAYLFWNETNQSYTTHTNSSPTVHNFTETFNIPFQSSDVSVKHRWNYTVGLYNGSTFSYNSTEHTQDIKQMLITNCTTADTGTETIVFYTYNESDRVSMYATVELSFELWSEDRTSSKSYGFKETNNTFDYCIYPTWATFLIDATIRYWNDTSVGTAGSNYPIRTYYIDNTTLTNTSQSVNMYLLNSVDATRTTIEVKDSYGDPQNNTVLQIQRYYTDTNTYITVTQPISDFHGKTVTYLELYTVYYKFIILRDNVVLDVKDAMLITDADLTLVLDPTIVIEQFNYEGKIAGSCSYSEASGLLTCIVTDTSGMLVKGCVQVSRLGAFGIYEECSTCETGSGVAFSCNLGNVSGQIYRWTLRAQLEGSTIWKTLEVVQKQMGDVLVSPIFGTCQGATNQLRCYEGVIMAFLLLGTACFIGIWSPSVSIIILIAGLVITTLWLGLVVINIVYVIGLIFVGLVIIYKVRV